MQKGAGVVAADADRDPGAGGAGAAGRQRAGEDLERLKQLDLRHLLDAGALEQHRQRPDVVGAEVDVDVGRALDDRRLVLLRQAPADGDLHAGRAVLDRLEVAEVAEVAVELVVGVLAHGAGVEHDDVRLRAVRDRA